MISVFFRDHAVRFVIFLLFYVKKNYCQSCANYEPVKDPKSFRSRAVSPRAGQGYLVQGSFKGKLDLHQGKEGGDDDDNGGSRDAAAALRLLRSSASSSTTPSTPLVVLTLVAPGQRVAAVAAVHLMSRTGGVAGHALLRGRLDETMRIGWEGATEDGAAAAVSDEAAEAADDGSSTTIASILAAAEAATVASSRAASAAARGTPSSSPPSSSAASAATAAAVVSPSSPFFGASSGRATCVSPTFAAWGPWGECCTPGAKGRCGVFCGEPGASRGRRRDILQMPPMNDPNRLPCLEPTSEVEDTCAAAPCQPPEPPKQCAGGDGPGVGAPVSYPQSKNANTLVPTI